MFGISKIKEAKQKAEELKGRLAGLDFDGESLNGMVSIKCTGEKKFHSLEINDAVFKVRPREEVQEMILQAITEAQNKADYTIEQEMKSIMPNIPGLGF
ncbi:MAG: YbaB/EbfC family nucleoid-associated protein [Bacteroidia bacterium]|nr:YbaB/EbfC family nucleoid-associated protein [Bacteroidia bacterium]NNJ54792.1 YbaB/EbfC family nucleoid-associated protein [Bacteroidia bacterium]